MPTNHPPSYSFPLPVTSGIPERLGKYAVLRQIAVGGMAGIYLEIGRASGRGRV